MRVVGRILQAVGWIWIVAGFAGPAFGFDAPNFFPGIILLFISRFFRANAARTEPPEDDGEATAPQPERILNTDRVQTPPPAPRPAPRPAPQPTPPRPDPIFEKPAAEPEDIGTEEDLFERILLAGTAAADEMEKSAEPGSDVKHKSSQDMIAEARERWGKKP